MHPGSLVAAVAWSLVSGIAIELGSKYWAARQRQRRQLGRGRRAGPGDGQPKPKAFHTPSVQLLKKLGKQFGFAAPGDLSLRIEASGTRTLQLSDAMAIKTGSAIVGGALAVALIDVMPGRLGLALIATLPAFAFMSLDLWLKHKTRLRVQVLNDELADVLDLLRVTLTSGCGVTRSLQEVGARHHSLLATELAQAAHQIAMGETFASAMTKLRRRCPTRGVQALIEAVTRAELHGTPLTDALAAQSEQARADRARRRNEIAARAAPKIQLIVALLLVPSVLLLLAAALFPALTGIGD